MTAEALKPILEECERAFGGGRAGIACFTHVERGLSRVLTVKNGSISVGEGSGSRDEIGEGFQVLDFSDVEDPKSMTRDRVEDFF